MAAAKLLVVYHSQSGRNARLAYAAAAAAREEGGEVCLARAAEVGCRDLLWCDALLLFTPENFGALPGELKDFLDRSFYPANTQQLLRPYGVFVCTGNDGSGALRELQRIAKGLVLKMVAEPIICKGAPGDDDFDAAKELAAAMVVAVDMGVY
ncbi:flavodoxin family protein [Spongiibacter sp.]|uniref:flavodoxin family protein n=1 Tax=Spongiibacter sp. TaxID=2024860 RepID=UPI0035674A81